MQIPVSFSFPFLSIFFSFFFPNPQVFSHVWLTSLTWTLGTFKQVWGVREWFSWIWPTKTFIECLIHRPCFSLINRSLSIEKLSNPTRIDISRNSVFLLQRLSSLSKSFRFPSKLVRLVRWRSSWTLHRWLLRHSPPDSTHTWALRTLFVGFRPNWLPSAS